MTSYADQNETSPPLGPASSDAAATLLGFWVPSGVTISADQNETWPSMGAANCETAITVVDSGEGHWHDVLRGSE